MSDLATTVLDLKSDFVCEALDLGQVHLLWTGRHLQQGRFDEALASFEKLVSVVRAAAPEMKAIKSTLADKALAAEANTEWRKQRDAKGGRAAA